MRTALITRQITFLLRVFGSSSTNSTSRAGTAYREFTVNLCVEFIAQAEGYVDIVFKNNVRYDHVPVVSSGAPMAAWLTASWSSNAP